MPKGGEIFVLDMGAPVKIDTLARNLIKMSGLTPDVDIKVNPDRLDLVETKFIGGRRCLVIAVEDNVEVNGMPVKMWEEQKEVQ